MRFGQTGIFIVLMAMGACKQSNNAPSLALPVERAEAQAATTAPSQEVSAIQKSLDDVSRQVAELNEDIQKKEEALQTAKATGSANQTEIDALKAQIEADRKKAEEMAAQTKAIEDQLKKAQTEKNVPTTQNTQDTGTTVIEKAKVAFSFQHNGQYCLDMAGDSVTSGTVIQLYRCGTTPSQWFDLHRLSSGQYHIVRNDYTKGRPNNYQCLHIVNHSQAVGAAVETRTCDGSASQIFQLLDQGNGVFVIRNLFSGKCLEAQNAGAADGVKVIQTDCVGNPSHRMQLLQR